MFIFEEEFPGIGFTARDYRLSGPLYLLARAHRGVGDLKPNNIKTLILEDNLRMKMILSTVLEAFGFRQIYSAASNAEALKLSQEIQFDLILVDQKIGGTNGLRFVKWIRDRESSPNPYVPIIMVSAYSERRRIIGAINAGVDEFLVKPVKPVDIARRIDAVTYKRRDFIDAPNYFGPDRRRRDDPDYSGPRRRITDADVMEDVFEFD